MALLGMLSGLAGFVKVRYLLDKAIIDNMVFRFHYRITSAILFLCCIIVTANNLIGDPIQCINDSIPNHVINTFCWITYTFTMPGYLHKPIGTHVPAPGLGNDIYEEKRYHSYYQWVPFVLFFQGLLFYAPHWMWKNWEDGKIRLISEGMRGTLICSKQERVFREEKLVNYIMDTLHLHNTYAFGYFFCEALNFINVVANIIFVDKFLGGSFMSYGMDVLRFSNLNQENRTDPMVQVFPRITKCTFHKFGASGTIQKHDAMCILALNILNEKIYIFLWFWFVILAILSCLALVYSAAVILMPSTREAILKRKYRFSTQEGLSALIRKTQVGDFLLLHLLGQNMSVLTYGEIMDEISKRLSSKQNVPSAPSTFEMSPIYPELHEKFGIETET